MGPGPHWHRTSSDMRLVQARGARLGNGGHREGSEWGHRLQRGPSAGPQAADAEARQPRGTPSCALSSPRSCSFVKTFLRVFSPKPWVKKRSWKP